MCFAADQCGRKDTNDAQIGLGIQTVAFMFVEAVQRAGFERIHLSVAQVRQGGFSFDDEIGLDVILVFHLLALARRDCGLGHGETDPVIAQQVPCTGPHPGPLSVATSHLQFIQVSDNHAVPR